MQPTAEHLATLFREHAELLERVADELTEEIVRAHERMHHAVSAGRKILVCGNGGSAADAQHFAAELVGRFGRPGAPVPALALTVDTSVLTAVANDLGYDEIFARQIEALGRPGDVLLVLSTSGRSPNILRACEVARQRGIEVVALLGRDTSGALAAAEIRLNVPSSDTQRTQEMHGVILHALGELLIAGS